MLEARLFLKKPLYEEKVTTFFTTKMVAASPSLFFFLAAATIDVVFINIVFLREKFTIVVGPNSDSAFTFYFFWNRKKVWNISIVNYNFIQSAQTKRPIFWKCASVAS